VFEPSETQGLREENVLKVTHVPGGKEKEFFIHFENMVFLCFWCLLFGKHIEYGIYLGSTVDLGDNIERAGRIEDEYRLSVETVKLGEYTADGTVATVYNDIIVLLDIMLFRQGGEVDGSDIEMRMRNGFSDREYLHDCP
jgi:hypothetical protein